ncbi:MAG: hypothetical protein Aurels2KO_54880 [Aureliella sp.]
MSNNETHAQPLDEIRFGNVRAAIWENTSSENKVFYGCTIEVSYTTDHGEWKQKKSYSLNECLRLEKAASQAAIRIQQLTQEAAKSARLDQQAQDAA